MFLKSLTIYGFKSFAAKSVLDFENEEIAGIVGPNGSGKSNVADAIRWVLGEQSNSLLRSKKSEDIVFVGSQRKARSSYAEVSLLLSGNRDVEVEIAGKKQSFKEIEITRKLYRSGEGEYLINRKKVRLIDLQTLLASLGFAQSSYTVIGQGMVDRMLFFNATERKVLFDEAAGIKQYKIKRGQATKRLETTEENLIRLKDINKELSPRVENLRRLVKKAEGRAETEKELAETEQRYFGSLVGELSENIYKLNLKKEGLVAKINYLENEKKGLSEVNGGVPTDNTFTLKQDKTGKELVHLSEERDRYLKEISFIEGQIREQENIFYNLKTGQQRLSKDKETILKEIERLKTVLVSRRKSGNELTTIVEKAEKEIQKIQSEIPTSFSSPLQEDLAKLEKQKNELEVELTRTEEAERLQKKVAADNKERKFLLAQEVVKGKQILKEKEKEKDSQSKKIGYISQEIKNAEATATKCLNDIKKIESEIFLHRERINPAGLNIFNKEWEGINTAHSILSELLVNKSKELKTHFDAYSKRFENIYRLTKEFVQAIDPVLREKLEKELFDIRERYLSTQKALAEKTKEIEKAKHQLALIDHEIGHLKEKIAEKTTAGEKIQLSTLSFSAEIVAARAKLEEKTSIIIQKKKQLEREAEDKRSARQKFNDRLDEARQKIYENKVRQAENSTYIRETERELERLGGRLSETESLLVASNDERYDTNLKKELSAKKANLAKLEKEIETAKNDLETLNEMAKDENRKAIEKERKYYELIEQESQVKERINEIELEKARSETRIDAIKEEIKDCRIELTNDYEVLTQSDRDILRARIENLRRKKDSIATVDPETIGEYEETEKRLSDLVKQLEDLEKAKNDLERLISELDSKITNQFSTTFKLIAERFQKYFSLLFEGGKANLVLEQDEDSKDLGIEITANPPGKKVQSLSMLSGGERTLTSLALVFAILSTNPSPFCVLDEVDAALDESNTSRFVKILRELDKKTQFIVITHNRETMKVAHYLYGLTMNDEHISELFSVKLAESLT